MTSENALGETGSVVSRIQLGTLKNLFCFIEIINGIIICKESGYITFCGEKAEVSSLVVSDFCT